MKKNNFKYFALIIIVLCITVGCSNKLEINTEYDSIKLEVTNTMNAGCHEIDDDTYFTHNIQDKHIYEIDYQNNIEYIKTDHWIGYNIDNTQYVSGDLGMTYMLSSELTSKIFEDTYQEDLIKILKYIDDSDKNNVTEKSGEKKFNVNFEKNQENVFQIIKKFGTINSSDKLKKLTTTATVTDNNVTNIVFDITSTTEDNSMDICYRVEWNLSNYNSVEINVPNDIG